jgi:hypothetical protein
MAELRKVNITTVNKVYIHAVKLLVFVGYRIFVVFGNRLIHEITNPTNNETWEAV